MGERLHLVNERQQRFAELMYLVIEREIYMGQRNLVELFMRLQDLTAYSVEHPEVQKLREGVELLALKMTFGMSEDDRFRENWQRTRQLPADVVRYAGVAEKIGNQLQKRTLLHSSDSSKP